MPTSRATHVEIHRTSRIGWLRAAVLGANDGIVSTASLLVGVAASNASHAAVLVAGTAGLAAGAMSMAAGEYVSVSSQSDTERADVAREAAELAADSESELAELAGIYQSRGVDAVLALQVARQMTAHDALGAHSRDELGISAAFAAKPLQAAASSACSFTVGALLPLIVAALSPHSVQVWTISLAALLCLAMLGVTGARVGGAGVLRPALRITLWGAAAMVATAGIGAAVGAVV